MPYYAMLKSKFYMQYSCIYLNFELCPQTALNIHTVWTKILHHQASLLLSLLTFIPWLHLCVYLCYMAINMIIICMHKDTHTYTHTHLHSHTLLTNGVQKATFKPSPKNKKPTHTASLPSYELQTIFCV